MSLVLEIFVSSPSDLAEERKVVAEVVGKLAVAAHVRPIASLRAQLYEDLVPPVLANSPQDAVNTFMMDPARCDVLVCLLGDRLGTAMADPRDPNRKYRSGTEYELLSAIESTKRPRPQALVYYRSVAQAGSDPAHRGEVEAFVAEFRRGEGKLKGISPAAFHDVADLRRQIVDHLNEVVTYVLRANVVRRWRRIATLLCSVLLVAAAVFGVTRQVERSSASGALATARAEIGRLEIAASGEPWREKRTEATAVLAAAVAPPLQAVRELSKLSCPAAQPLLNALQTREAQTDLEIARAIVPTLAKVAAAGLGRECGCDQLLSVLDLEHPKARFCQATHQLTLEELARVECPGKTQVLCNYLRKVEGDRTLVTLGMCEGEVPITDDLARKALAALGGDRGICGAQGGRP